MVAKSDFAKKVLEKIRFFEVKSLICTVLVSPVILWSGFSPHWGFWAHKRINRMAVYRLPAEMQFFYKKHIDYLSENATNPDKRRYSVVGEAERHFIDLDV